MTVKRREGRSCQLFQGSGQDRLLMGRERRKPQPTARAELSVSAGPAFCAQNRAPHNLGGDGQFPQWRRKAQLALRARVEQSPVFDPSAREAEVHEVNLDGVLCQRDIVFGERRPRRGTLLLILGHHTPFRGRVQEMHSDAYPRDNGTTRRTGGDRIAVNASCQARVGLVGSASRLLRDGWTPGTERVRPRSREPPDDPGRGRHRPARGSRSRTHAHR
jgi:hypothetical protein